MGGRRERQTSVQMEGMQMKDIIKQSEETKIEWRIMGNPVVSCESTTEAILTIHPDGRVTTSQRLKPDEISALVLDQIKTAWMKDAQAAKIREMQYRIKRLEEAGDALCIAALYTGWVEKVEAWTKSKEAKP